jgi:preprotein translocase subunit SecE
VTKSTATIQKDNRLVKYFKDTRAELRKVTWPTREEAINLTIVVLVVTLIMTILLFLVDSGFNALFQWLLTLGGG